MKQFIKIILTLSFANLNCIIVTAQTNVSGVISTNTTWTVAGSPYIILDTVTVDPFITLTIQPGSDGEI